MKKNILKVKKMYKKIMMMMLLSFLVISAASAADFKLNDGFIEQSEYYSLNNDTGMHLCT